MHNSKNDPKKSKKDKKSENEINKTKSNDIGGSKRAQLKQRGDGKDTFGI